MLKDKLMKAKKKKEDLRSDRIKKKTFDVMVDRYDSASSST
jgi:hypothetical protein